MWFGIISLFPEMFQSLTEHGVSGRAFRNDLARMDFWNPRDFTQDVHRTVDDRPYGGGPGMLMKTQPLADAIAAARQASRDVSGSSQAARVIYMSPQGKQLNQSMIEQGVQEQQLILLCGRYEGVDERLLESEVDEEWSISDIVLSGGELAAMCIADAMLRLVPGVLGDAQSAEQDSFTNDLLDCPHYTRPEIWREQQVPEVLLSGNHKNIAAWRKQQAEQRTRDRRPDLFAKYESKDRSK